MVAVAIAAIVLGIGVESRRRSGRASISMRVKFRREEAAYWANQRIRALQNADYLERYLNHLKQDRISPERESKLAQFSEELARGRKDAAYCGRMKDMYIRAASHPWESVTPEPPVLRVTF
jgi:hypothetical protein